MDRGLSADKEDLRVQYQQCIENYRMWDRHVWQVPSITIVIASVIIGVAFGYLKEKDALIPSMLVLLFGMLFSFSMFIAVKKYRFFQYHTIERMRAIEGQLGLEPLRLITDKDGMNPQNWTDKQRAGTWLSVTALSACICLTGLLIFKVVIYFYG